MQIAKSQSQRSDTLKRSVAEEPSRGSVNPQRNSKYQEYLSQQREAADYHESSRPMRQSQQLEKSKGPEYSNESRATPLEGRYQQESIRKSQEISASSNQVYLQNTERDRNLRYQQLQKERQAGKEAQPRQMGEFRGQRLDPRIDVRPSNYRAADYKYVSGYSGSKSANKRRGISYEQYKTRDQSKSRPRTPLHLQSDTQPRPRYDYQRLTTDWDKKAGPQRLQRYKNYGYERSQLYYGNRYTDRSAWGGYKRAREIPQRRGLLGLGARYNLPRQGYQLGSEFKRLSGYKAGYRVLSPGRF